MRIPIIPRPLTAVALVAVLLSLSAVAAFLSTRDGPDRPSLIGVPTSAYDGSDGVELVELRLDSQPSISAQEAQQTALSAIGYGNGIVRQVILARYLNTNAIPDIENLVWAVNFEPSTVRWHRPAACGIGCGGIRDELMDTTLAVLLIDAETGEVVSEWMSGCQRLDFDSLDTFVFGARQRPVRLCG